MKKIVCLLTLIILVSGCASAARMAGVSPELEETVGKIGYYRDSPSEGTYVELGEVIQQFNPLLGSKDIEWTLKMQAYSRYGEKADAIIRIQATVVSGYQFPLRQVRGTVVQYK